MKGTLVRCDENGMRRLLLLVDMKGVMRTWYENTLMSICKKECGDEIVFVQLDETKSAYLLPSTGGERLGSPHGAQRFGWPLRLLVECATRATEANSSLPLGLRSGGGFRLDL